MNKFLQRSFLMMALSGLVMLAACSEDPPLPENITEFESDELGFTSTEQESIVNIKLAREVEADGTITVAIEPTGVVYGTDFTTEPAASGTTITVPVVTGAITASFKVKKAANTVLDGDEKIKFTITGVSDVLVLGEKTVLTLSFAEIIAATGTLEISGGGATYPNKVFIDFSSNRQTAVNRANWDLGFSTTDDFRVILNSSNGMMARALAKTDLTAVTAADTVGFGVQLGLPQVFAAINAATTPAWTNDAIKWIDDPTGDWSKTAIAQVSATASENKVYIINRGVLPGATASAGWKKIRIIRNGNNYTLQHADIAATTFTSVEVTKGTASRFDYVSFATGKVDVEPAKTKWDIAWTGFANSTNFGSGPVPYYFQDVVIQNTTGVQTVQVLNTTVTYDAFTEANLAGLVFSTSQVNIGAGWRSGGGPGVSPAVRTDRFYVVKDAEGNIYKVKFTALTTNGERGKPQVQYALVKKAS
jgi:HmuY protein